MFVLSLEQEIRKVGLASLKLMKSVFHGASFFSLAVLKILTITPGEGKTQLQTAELALEQ